MPTKFRIEETCYVPTSLLPDENKYPVSIYRTTIKDIKNKSVKVQQKDGTISDWITTSKVSKNIGILIISIGDFSTEETLLNPLAKSILQFSRLLLEDDSVMLVKVRSIGELSAWWKLNDAAYSHVVLIGHGSPTGIIFGYGGKKSPTDFEKCFSTGSQKKKVFISLCCETGRNLFASSFSQIPICSHLIAPYHSIHGSVASQFYQTIMCWHLIDARSIKIAYNKAQRSIPKKYIFRSWTDGYHNTEMAGWRGW